MGLFGKKIVGKAPAAQAVPAVTPIIAPPPMSMAFDSKTFKMKLKLGKARSETHHGKAVNAQLRTRQAVIEELRNNKNPTAYIRMEQLLRDTAVAEAHDMVDVYIDLCVARIGMIESCRDFSMLSSDMREAIASLAFASTRMNIVELRAAVDILRVHYGAQVIDPLCHCNGPDAAFVNSLMARKLDGTAPDGYEILDGLTQIAREENLPWFAPAEPEDLRKSYVTSRPQPNFEPYPQVGGFFASNVPGVASAPFVPDGEAMDGGLYPPSDGFGGGPSSEFPPNPPPPGPPGSDFYR